MIAATESNTTSQRIIADIIATLATMTIDGVRAFARVRAIEDVESFVRVADALEAKQAEVGVIEGSLEQRNGIDDTESAIVRLALTIAVRFSADRPPGGGENFAMSEARRFTQAIRDGLLKDPSRGGIANLISFGGQIINGTDVSGAARLTSKQPNNGFFTVLIPAACGWSIS